VRVRRTTEPRVFKHPSDRGNRQEGLCRRCYEAGGVVNECPVCGNERNRPLSHAHKKCCGYSCATRYRWRRGTGLRAFIERWGGKARRKRKRVWRARQVGKLGGRRRGYDDEQAVLARRIKAKYPTLGRATIAQMVAEATGRPFTEKQARHVLETA
jgi:hypothetical protein